MRFCTKLLPMLCHAVCIEHSMWPGSSSTSSSYTSCALTVGDPIDLNFSILGRKSASLSACATMATIAAFFRSGASAYALILSKKCSFNGNAESTEVCKSGKRATSSIEGLSLASCCVNHSMSDLTSLETRLSMNWLISYVSLDLRGGFPVSSVCRMHPMEKISAFSLYGWLFKTSGAMKPSVPILLVRRPSLPDADAPKSVSFKANLPSFSSGAVAQRKFPGFKSRCTIPMECKYLTLATICLNKCSASASEKCLPLMQSMYSSRSPPLHNSVIKYRLSSSSKVCSKRDTCG
mmetsp:Transcript_64547/g.118873  ORF Transcript_64547/g.118873 Transcript_64547/m.118873 type:complete len:293 (+) Transcript_64547:481-1359(+)